MSSCLFCATLCPPKFTFVDGQVKRLKRENDPRNPTSPPSSTLGFGREDSVIAEQLKVVFILRNILKLKQDKLCEFLGSSGQLHPEYWISVCLSCEKTVGLFYQTVKDIGRLQKKLLGFSNELKRKIRKSKLKEGRGPTGGLWEEIRNEVLIDTKDVSERERIISGPSTTTSESEYDPEEDSQDSYHQDDADDVEEDYVPNSKQTIRNGFTSIAKNVLASTSKVKQKDSKKIIILVKPEVDLILENEECEEVNESATYSSMSDLHSSLFLDPDDDEDDQGVQFELHDDDQLPDDSVSQNKNDKNIITSFDDSDPRCTKFYRGNLRRYGCRECPAEENSLNLFLIHSQLHKMDSGAIPCPECGWFVMPNKLQRHNGQHHKHLQKRPQQKQNLWYYQCPECNALICAVSRYREHEQMHEKGEGIICEEEGCGWLVKEVGRHRKRWHDSESSILDRIKNLRRIRVMEKRSGYSN